MNQLQDIIRGRGQRKRPVVAVITGSGQVARYAVEAGADLLMVLNAGVYRNLGIGSLGSFLPYGNANDQTERLLREQILPRAGGVPIVAGLWGADPTLDLQTRFGRLQALGVDGLVNWPAVGLIDGAYRQALEADDLGVTGEIVMLEAARKAGFVTFGFALGVEDVRRFVKSGADALVLTMGLTRKVDDIHEKRDQLQHAIAGLNGMLEAAGGAGRQLFCLAHGGPITTPEDLEQLFRHSPIDGIAGGSVFERLPIHSIVMSTVRRFKSIALHHGQPAGEIGLCQMVGQSADMEGVFELVKRIAPYDVNVCVEGESGTGKELVAAQIHRMSNRANHPFVTLNCGAIPDTLLESELFGHEKGAFTGADRRRLGKFELAHRGTLFLDEIADLSPHGQVALLRALQQREITRVGGETSIPVDVRIVAASNQPLADSLNQGKFRADLYYRLNHVSIVVPPVRARVEDIPLLVEDILSRLQIQLNKKLVGLSTSFHDKLRQHSWPGNVRELQHVVGQAALREDGPVLEGWHFSPQALRPNGENGFTSPAKNSRSARQIVARKALQDAGGNKSRAAAALGVTRKTLYAWLEENS